jgi:hypothetical protein
MLRPVARHRCRLALIALLACLGAFASVTDAASAQSEPTVLICEATGNPAAPYVEIRVPQSQLGNYSAAEGDIIPAPAGGCPGAAGSTAPVETSGTATTSATTSSTTSATSSATVSPPVTATAPAPVHHKKKSAAAGTEGTQTSLAATNPIVESSTTTSATETPAASTISSLPKTGGQVPLTMALGLAALFGAAVLRLALAGFRRREPTGRR